MKMYLSLITQAMMIDPYFSYIKKPSDVNNGDCYYWAFVASQLYGGVLCSVRCRFGSHAFVKIDNKYYDSESPNGVNDWRDLIFFENSRSINFNDCIEQSEKEFLDSWFMDRVLAHNLFVRSKQIIYQKTCKEDSINYSFA